jgi:hypothetical protein
MGFLLILNSVLLIFYVYKTDVTESGIKSTKEFKLRGSLYKCEKTRELTELEK